MAFGFGFNKAKVLNSAEKHVQQGKIQNAITDYEKVLQHEPKDLTILNTLGDLYARIGDPDRAASYFKKVGDAYAADGFTVKAIALYKKVTKINPSGIEDIRRLAELYTQQNLLSDARQQYLLVAEQYTKTNRLDAAINIFRKMLEFDPDNVAMQTRLAELYVRVGKKEEAQEIFFASARALHKRGSAEGADEALTRVLTLSPGNPPALLMRAQIAIEGGHHTAAVRHLESIPNIDSSPEGLGLLLRARLALAQAEEAEPLARKLLVVHDDLSGINHFADWLASRGLFEAALRIYDEHSDRLLANNPERLLNALRTFTERVKENATALELVLSLLQKAGEQSQITEVIELLAHALVQRGDLARARDFYRDLSILEPQNPVHEQNYRQMVARLGQDSVVWPLSPQEGGRAFMAEELETAAPPLEQPLEPDVERALEAALTEAELLESYNLHPKALETLEAILPKTPRSARLHKRLATLYAQSQRLSDAAQSCDLLAELYQDGGHASQAKEYKGLGARYRQQAEASSNIQSTETKKQSASVLPEAQSAEFKVEVVANASREAEYPGAEPTEFTLEIEPQQPAAVPEWTSAASPATPLPATSLEEVPQPMVVAAETSPAAEIEFDISDEWQPAVPAVNPAAAPVPPDEPDQNALDVAVEGDQPSSPAAELLEEIRFYIGQQMWDEAAAVIPKCATLMPNLPELAELKRQIEQATRSTPEPMLAEPLVTESLESSESLESLEEDAAGETVLADEPANHQPEFEPMAAPVLAQPFSNSGAALDNLVAGLEDALPADLTAESAAEAPNYTAPVPPAPVFDSVAEVSGNSLGPQHSGVEELDLPDVPPASRNALSELFDEFKQETEQAASDHEDPESHYNLGIAFREMGLLDEAIGELQKVARNIEMRLPFRDTLQVYTLLGQCFLEKGVPEAAVRWYEKALSSASDGEARVAVHYELGSAHEAAGSRPSALKHFMEVYGANIDYRDVAERIRVLKS